MIRYWQPATNKPTRWVRFDFHIDGIVGREVLVVSADSYHGAIAVAGMAFGMDVINLARELGIVVAPVITLVWVEYSEVFAP